jgi:hypothetical protein
MAQARLFSAGPGHPTRPVAWGPRLRAFASRSKIAGLRHPPLTLRPCAALRVLGRAGRRLVIATKAAIGAADPAKGPLPMTTDHDDTEFEPPHNSSPTDQLLSEIQLYGYRPFHDEPDPRPLPEGGAVAGALADIFAVLVSTLSDTRLEPDLDHLLWSTVNLFHRAVDRIECELDRNEQAQLRSQKEQDGSEIRSVELERLTAEGVTLIERRNSMEFFRDEAADQFERHTGSAWRPRSRSKINHRNLTAAMIDSRDFLAAKKRADNEVLLPVGPKIAVTGGLDFNDHRLIWDRLDKAHAKHPDMVLLHGGSPKGAELIAAKWASSRRVPQIAFRPDWTKHAKAAPFKRNDAMLDVLPIGVMVFPGTGIQDNLADKARKLGVPVWRFGGGGA